jgi:alpha-galactosidase
MAHSLAPHPREFRLRNTWFKEHFTPTAPAFSFIYDGKSSRELLPTWRQKSSITKLDEQRAQRTLTYTDPQTGLQVRLVMVTYEDFPVVEWTVYLKNTGPADTPIIENLQALDIALPLPPGEKFYLHHFTGSPCREDDFEPQLTALAPGVALHLAGEGGRPTSATMCYFNLETAAQQGMIIALGWPGQWTGDFARDAAGNLHVVCGQELTHLRLHPGEEIRTPLVALQFWQGGDWLHAQVLWRRWMVAHNMPHPNGAPLRCQYGECAGNMQPSAAGEIAAVDSILNTGVTLDHWIIDAGWYPCDGSWPYTGTWEPDPERFPKGLREVADYVHAKGIEFIVWFEPERAYAGRWLTVNHPEWVLGEGDNHLVNLGDPAAQQWVTDHISDLLTREGIDHYRGDFNIDPLPFWRGNDAEDRQGMTENLYVQGFLAFWDELIRRHPGLYIDTCASGGRRLDLETVRRSVPLLRSDWPIHMFTPDCAIPPSASIIGQQCQTYGLSLWIPYHGTGAPVTDIYTLRSSYCAAYRTGFTPAKYDIALFQQAIREVRQLLPFWLDDFYPLTPYSRDQKSWLAWQLDDPDKGEGAIQVFRRDASRTAAMRFKLHGLDPKASYVVTNVDTGVEECIIGRTLLTKGLTVTIPDPRGSAVILYKKANEGE